MTPANRRRLVQSLLLLALVFGLVNFVAGGARSLTLKVNDSRIKRVEVFQQAAMLATVEFSNVPNQHTFRLPEGTYELRGSGVDGILKSRHVQLDDDLEVFF